VAGEDPVEVVVVDDGSRPETAALLERAAGAGELTLRVVRHERALGPARARNAGWRAASAALVAFTDDDCTPSPGWLAAGLAAHRARPEALVQGRTAPDPAEREGESLWTRTLRVDSLGPWYETCNMFYPRELLEALGGFEDFGLAPGGEDTDLAWRALEAGRPAVWAPAALVFHAVERIGARGQLRVAARWTATTRVLARHPPIRVALERGVFWNVYHYLLLRSLVALVLPRPLRRFLLLRHALELHRRARAAGTGWWAVPYLVLHDAVEMWSVARGGVRHRTLVL